MNALSVVIDKTADVVGYACGECGYLYVVSRADESQRMVEYERDRAEACCVCARCGVTGVGIGNACGTCRKAQFADVMEAGADEVRAEAQSFTDAETSHDGAWTFTIKGGRTGRVYSCDAGPFYSAYARLDPTADDPEPIAHSATLVRRESQAVLDAVDCVCRQYDTTIERMEVVR